jgi:osmotically-inducible protein OsmY
MKALICFTLGVVVGIAAHWYFAPNRFFGSQVTAREEVRTGAVAEVKRTVREVFNSAAMKEELAKTGRIIREKSRQAGAIISDATANARTTASIKSKLVEDSGLAALKIDVDTTDGVVTLSGKVNSYEEIDRATNIALATEGVHKVISTLQVKEAAPAEVEVKQSESSEVKGAEAK